MRVLALVTDAYGGTGGIAQYGRDLIEATAAHPYVSEIVVLPRKIVRQPQPLPGKVTHVVGAARSKVAYVAAVLRACSSGTSFRLIVCAHVNLLPVAIVAGFLSGARVVLVAYGVEVWRPRNRHTVRLLNRVAAVISISEVTLERMSEWSDTSRMAKFILPNAVDLSAYSPGPRNEDMAVRWALNGSPVLLTLGRMNSEERAKGFDEIMNVIPGLLKEFPGLVYCAAGDGDDRIRLRDKAMRLGIGDRVRFPGYVKESEKADCFRLADVYVMPSRLEGFGFVYLEALACGLPVIGSRTDGSREALRGGMWGLLVDPDNSAELVSAIRSAVLDPRVPPRDELEYFSKARFAARYSDILDTLIGAGPVADRNQDSQLSSA